MARQFLLEPVPAEERLFDASRYGCDEPIRLRRLEDLGALVRVAATQRLAKSLAAHWSAVFGFPVSPEAVQVAAVVSACWAGEDPPSVEHVVRMSRDRGRLLIELLRVCNELNGWEDDGPFGSAGGGTGC
jgi:hypothetical protein